MCAYGSPSKKPTSVLTNMSELSCLDRRCPGVSRNHQHVQLVGARWTASAGAYPDGLCRVWASLVGSALRNGAARGGSQSDVDDFLGNLEAVAAEPALRSGSGARSAGPHRFARADVFLRQNPSIRFGQDARAQRWFERPAARAEAEDPQMLTLEISSSTLDQ